MIPIKLWSIHTNVLQVFIPGADPGFQVMEGALKKIAPKFVGYFVGKIKIFRQKVIFFSIAEGSTKFWEYFVLKFTIFTPKNHIFSNFMGAHTGCTPWIRPCILDKLKIRTWFTPKNIEKILCDYFLFLNQEFCTPHFNACKQ